MKTITVKAILLFLAISIFLCSCGASVPEVFDEEFVSSGSGYDLEGYTVKYICGEDGTLLGYGEDTYFYDMTKQRIASVEKELNCIVTTQNVKSTDYVGMITATASGVYYGDAFGWVGDMLGDAAAAGLLVGLSTVAESLDIKDSDKWGSKYQLESVCYKDDVYGFIPYYWPERSYSEMGFILTINEDIVSKIGATDPREYVENRTWTWSQFRECLDRFVITEGSETKVYAMSYPEDNYAQMYIRSNGSNLVSIAPNGDIVNGLTDERAMKAMQEAIDVKTQYAHTFSKVWLMDEIVDAFAAGSITMGLFNSEKLLTKVAYQVENFGIVKWPTGPDVDPDFTFSLYSNITPTSISILTPDANATALILDKLYEPFEGYKTLDDIKDYMRKLVFHDERDCDTFFGMIENTKYDYFHFQIAGRICDYLDAGLTIAQSVEAFEDSVADAFEEHVAPCIEGIISVYGSYGD